MIKDFQRKEENLYDLRSWIDWLSSVLTLLFSIILPITFIFIFPLFIAHGNYFLIVLDLGLRVLCLLRAFIPGTAKYFPNIIWLLILYLLTISFFIVLGPNYARSAWMILCAVIAAIIFGVEGAIISSTDTILARQQTSG